MQKLRTLSSFLALIKLQVPMVYLLSSMRSFGALSSTTSFTLCNLSSIQVLYSNPLTTHLSLLFPKPTLLRNFHILDLLAYAISFTKSSQNCQLVDLDFLWIALLPLFQNAFIQERTITNNILIAHEIFDLLGKKSVENKVLVQ